MPHRLTGTVDIRRNGARQTSNTRLFHMLGDRHHGLRLGAHGVFTVGFAQLMGRITEVVREGEFDRYLGREEVDLARDLVGYRQLALHLTDEETVGMLTEMSEVVARYVDRAPGPDRTRRILTTVLMPG